MPLRYRTLDDLGLFVVTCTGKVTLRDELELLDAIENDPDIKDGMVKFADCRGVTEIAITSDELDGLADLQQSLEFRSRKSTRTIVWAPNDLAYDAANRFLARFPDGEGAISGVFRVLEDAARALGLSPMTLRLELLEAAG